MNLVWFLTIGTLFSIILGEFGQFPFGTSTTSLSLTDILLTGVISLLLIWQVETKTVIRKLPRIMQIMCLFWITGLLSLVFSGNFGGSIYLLRFIIYSMSLYLGYSLIRSKVVSIEAIFTVLGYLGVLLSIFGFIQLLVFPDLQILYMYGYDPHKNRLFSTFLDPNLLGSFLSLSLMVVLYLYLRNKRTLTLFWCFVIGFAILFTFSRSAYVMIFVGLFCFFWFYSKKILLILGITALCTIFIVAPIRERVLGAILVDKSASERIVSWKDGLTILEQRPILGVGFNNLRASKIEENLLKNDEKSDVHSGSGLDSSFLFVGATSGIIGLVVYLVFWVFVIKTFLRNLQGHHRLLSVCLLSMIVGIVANSQFINSLFFTPIVFVLLLLIGGYVAVTEHA